MFCKYSSGFKNVFHLKKVIFKGKPNLLLMIHFFILLLLLLILSCTCDTPSPTPPTNQLAISTTKTVLIVDPATQQTVHEFDRYVEILGLAYRPDGERLAVFVGAPNQVVELETANYTELMVVMEGGSGPKDIMYSPDNLSLAGIIPKWFPDSETGMLWDYLQVAGNNPLERKLGRPLPALAYRSGGNELAIAYSSRLEVLDVTADYLTLHTVEGISAISLDYTIDGSRLIAGTQTGFTVLDASNGYTVFTTDTEGKVVNVAVNPAGGWVAFVRENSISIRRAPDLTEAETLSATGKFMDADFSSDGSLLAVAEDREKVRLFQTATWDEQSSISIPAQEHINAVAFRPQGEERIPVLFVHGHTYGSKTAWFNRHENDKSFASALAANPQLPLDAFYLELPCPTCTPPKDPERGIEEDALDILAAIEGETDSQQREQVGILNMPAYQSSGKVAIIAYSKGAISSRYYLKKLIGDRRNGAITVSEYVTLAAPNHGLGGLYSCGDTLQPDRALRQLCGGISADTSSQSQPCGDCGNHEPREFRTNVPEDTSFLTDLNGHPFVDDCNDNFIHPEEAPHSRPTEPGGILYVNLYAAFNTDFVVGGGTQSLDCIGRRLAKNHAPDAKNIEIAVVPPLVHANFPHHWQTICVALRTVVDHQDPSNPDVACSELIEPQK
jgi:WD40 repeat protein